MNPPSLHHSIGLLSLSQMKSLPQAIHGTSDYNICYIAVNVQTEQLEWWNGSQEGGMHTSK